MNAMPSEEYRPTTSGHNSGQPKLAVSDHSGTHNDCDPVCDCSVSQSRAGDRGTNRPMAVDNSDDLICSSPDRNSSASSVYLRDRLGRAHGKGREAQLCAGAITTPHPWAPANRRILKPKRMSRISGHVRVRKLFGSNGVAAVDINGSDSPYGVQRYSAMALSNEEFPLNNTDNSHSCGDKCNKIHVVKSNSKDDCNIVGVECVDYSMNLSCDTERDVFFLPKSRLFALPLSNECKNPRNIFGDYSFAESARSPVISDRKRKLPLSKREKLARNDKQCLRFDRFDADSDQEVMLEDSILDSPSASFSKLLLVSPSPKQRLQNKLRRKCLFGKGDSSCEAHFYNFTSSSHGHSGQSSQ